MKIILIINFVLIVQVSASFLDVFQGAVSSVQNTFGKLISDVVTDVKETVDCTILAIEHVLSLSADATTLYNEKCGSGNGNNTTVTNNQQKENSGPTVEIFLNNQDNLNKLLPEAIDARINDTMMKIFQGYNPHDKLLDVERELAKETERLAEVSDLVKRELEKLSAVIHVNFSEQQRNDSKPSVDTILQELRLLEAIEKNIRNSSEANKIHKVIENVLYKLDAIEASEASENKKVDDILKELENNSNCTYKDLRKRLEDWKKDEDRHLDLIKKKIEQHEATPEHSVYLERNNLDTRFGSQANGVNITDDNSTQEVNKWTVTEQPKVTHSNSFINRSSSTASNVIPLYLASTFLTNVTITTTSPRLASTVLIPENTTINEVTHILPLSSDKLVESTSINSVKIEPRAIENTSKVSNDKDLKALLVRSLNHSEHQPDLLSTTPVFTSSRFVSIPIKEISKGSTMSLLKTTEHESITKLNNSDLLATTVSTNQTSTENKILLFTTPYTNKSAFITAEQIVTRKAPNKRSTTAQINDVLKNTTPVSITTSSYVNEIIHRSSITETVLITVPPIITNVVSNTLSRDLQPDYNLNRTLSTTTPSTIEQPIIVDTGHSIDTTSITLKILRVDTTTPTLDSREHTVEAASSTPSTGNHKFKDIPIRSTTPLALEVFKPSTITTPSLDAFLKYMDRLAITTTTTSTTIKPKNANRESLDPRLTQSRNILGGASPDYINNNSIAPINKKFATRSYHDLLNTGVPSLKGFKRGFKPSKPAYYADPTLYLRNDHSISGEKQNPSYMAFHNNNGPFPYIRNNTAGLSGTMPRSPRLLPTPRRYSENAPSIITKDKRTADVFNPKLDAYRGSAPKRNNFDDLDYDSFFHIPSKNAEHERALREARKLIADSQKSHRVMQNILSKNKKGINAFNLPYH